MEDDDARPVDASATLRALAVCLFIVEGLLFVGSLFLSVISMFAFDAPGAASDPMTWLIVVGAWAAPLVFAFGARNAWLAATRRDRLSLKTAVLAPTAMLGYLGLSLLTINP